MKQTQDEIRGELIVILVEGDIIPAQRIKASHQGLEIQSGTILTTVDPLNVRKIHALEPQDSFASIPGVQSDPHIREAMTRTLCGVLEIETLAKAYLEEKALGRGSLKIVIFGSASLALTILPNRVSHDVDAAGPMDFVKFCEHRMRKSHGAIPEFSSSRLLQYLGSWEERSSRVEGAEGITFHVLHPLDTVLQKLLRADEERFHINDLPDIQRILETLNPSKETLLDLLTENPSRYRIPETTVQGAAVRRNTNLFSYQFLPGHNFASLKARAEQLEEDAMEKYGFIPLRSIPVSTSPNWKLSDLLNKKDPPLEMP